MKSERPIRDDEVASVFSSSLEPIHRLFSRLDLTEDETEALDQELYGWFYRFSRRCGHDQIPAGSMRRALVLGAVQLMRDVAVLRQCAIPLLPRDLKEFAEQLSVDLERSEETTR